MAMCVHGSFPPRYTYGPQRKAVYAILLDWPKDGVVDLGAPKLGSKVGRCFTLSMLRPMLIELAAK